MNPCSSINYLLPKSSLYIYIFIMSYSVAQDVQRALPLGSVESNLDMMVLAVSQVRWGFTSGQFKWKNLVGAFKSSMKQNNDVTENHNT